MGTLRSDRITGLGGANAIKGSVSFNNNAGDYYNGYLKVNLDSSNRSNFDFDGDFTIECWVFKSKSTESGEYDGLLYISSDWRFKWQSSNKIMYYDNGTDAQFMNYNTNEGFLDNNWHHLAIVRSSNTITGYVDGTSYGTASESGDFDPGSNTELLIGYNVQGFGGNISNLRVVKGTAVYTGNFTPPTSELTAIDGTVLLCCQSPGNVLQEVTGNYVVESVVNPTADVRFSKPPSSSHFTPNSPVGFSTTTDVGTQFGSTFDGLTTFDSQAYFVPPGGNTRERNRGRALYAGGYKSPNTITAIDFIQIQSGGITEQFGDLSTTQHANCSACSSSTRMVTNGGWTGSVNNNVMEFVTIANSSNSTDFGELAVGRRNNSSTSNQTRGLVYGGNGSPANTAQVDFFTIATAGNAADFGDASSVTALLAGSASSSTRALFAGGYTPSASATIDLFTIASTGDATNFGNLSSARKAPGGLSSSTRSVFGGGGMPSAVDTIDFVTTATTGTAIDFGDLFLARAIASGTSNKTRGIFMGGTTSPARQNTIDFVTIASTGGAVDFGDFTTAKQNGGVASDSHGGL